MTPEILSSIVAADYGSGYNENLSALRDICETGLVQTPMEWNIHEVAALCRWADGERVDHIERALACTLLCLDYVQDTGYTEDIDSTVPTLLESCLELGADALVQLSGLLVWLIETEEPAEEPGDESGGVLAAQYALLLAQAALAPTDDRLVVLARSTVDIERALSAEGFFTEPERGWLNRVLCGLRDEKWRQLTARVLDAACTEHPQLTHLNDIRSLMPR